MYVKTNQGTEAREVELGLTDEMYIEVKSGLSEGEEIVLNPRALLSDKEKKGVKEDEKIVPTGGKGGGRGGKGRQGMVPGAGDDLSPGGAGGAGPGRGAKPKQ